MPRHAVQARHRLSKPMNDLYALDAALKVTARSPAEPSPAQRRQASAPGVVASPESPHATRTAAATLAKGERRLAACNVFCCRRRAQRSPPRCRRCLTAGGLSHLRRALLCVCACVCRCVSVCVCVCVRTLTRTHSLAVMWSPVHVAARSILCSVVRCCAACCRPSASR